MTGQFVHGCSHACAVTEVKTVVVGSQPSLQRGYIKCRPYGCVQQDAPVAHQTKLLLAQQAGVAGKAGEHDVGVAKEVMKRMVGYANFLGICLACAAVVSHVSSEETEGVGQHAARAAQADDTHTTPSSP